MPVTTVRTISIKDASGKVTLLTASDMVAEELDVTVTCGSSRCASRNGKQTTISWNSEEVKDDPNKIPDSFFKMIQIGFDPSDPNKKEVFCCAQCAKDYLTYDYVKPLSPREAAIQMAANQQADLRNRPAVVVDFPGRGPAVPIGEEIAVEMEKLEGYTLEDVDASKVTADPVCSDAADDGLDNSEGC
jgi:hypothetical protein